MLKKAELSKRQYSSKAKSFNVIVVESKMHVRHQLHVARAARARGFDLLYMYS
jgi:hypothetical protein